MAEDPDQDRRREAARNELRGELRDAVGPQAADRAERRGALDSAVDASRPRTIAGAFEQSRALILIAFFVALIAGAIVAVVSGIWWVVFVALALHAVGTVVIVATTLSLASQVESPDPRTAAALEEHGVRDPDAALNEAVRASADATEDEQAAEARAQQRAVTPSHESRPAGPGRSADPTQGEGP